MGHYMKRCKYCGIVFEQCRCADLNKPVIWGVCNVCQTSLNVCQTSLLDMAKLEYSPEYVKTLNYKLR
jgi:hypothetical protein